MTNWVAAFFPPACQSHFHSLPIPKYFSAMPWALFCFLLKLCVCASKEVQRAFEDAIQFSEHTSTVFCLLLYCAKKLRGFSLKAWSYSCFPVIKGHKVKSVFFFFCQRLTFHYFCRNIFWRDHSKILLLIWSLPLLMSTLYVEMFCGSVLVENRCSFSACQARSGALIPTFVLDSITVETVLTRRTTASVISASAPNRDMFTFVWQSPQTAVVIMTGVER